MLWCIKYSTNFVYNVSHNIHKHDAYHLKQNSSLFFIIIDFSQTLYIIYISYKWPVCDIFIQNYFFLLDIIRRAKGCKFGRFAGNGNSVSIFSKATFVKPRAETSGTFGYFNRISCAKIL